MEDSQEYTNIAQRLEQLNQWQEEQKKLLYERQDNQRKVLGLEHKKMYEMLGIFHQNSNTIMTDYTSECESASNVRNLEQTVDEEKENLQQNAQVANIVEKRPFLRRKQGLMNRFKVDPDNFRLDKLPPYKFQSKHPSIQFQNVRKKNVIKERTTKAPPPEVSAPKLSTPKKDEVTTKSQCPGIDLLEQKFQKSLMFSKTACNSTPDMKSQSSIRDTPEPISWATILDPQNVKPIEKQTIYTAPQESHSKSDESNIFELLEQKAKEGSFNLNSSFIRKFLNKNAPDDDDSLMSYEQTIRPTPHEISQDVTLKDSESSDEDSNSEPNEPKPKQKHSVRFVETPSVSVLRQNLSQTLESSDASQAFEEFKKRIFESQSGMGSTDVSQNNAFVEDILQKADLIKTRLSELEMEIATFQQNNLELIKSKREHEVEKVHFEQEMKEARDKLNDERIQMEIYLHDERMKIEDERKEWEKKVRLQKSAVTAKERREAAKLREHFETLQNELKKKEELHITAQSRLRSRIKNLEGNLRQLNLNMTELQKENKRLEAECLQANRQHSDKMLREINRNIAKLAPKGPWTLPSPLTTLPSESQTASQQPTKQSSHRKCSPPKRKSNLKTNTKPTIRPITPSSPDEEEEEGDSSETSFGESEFEKPKAVTFSKSPEREKSTSKDQANSPATAPSDNSFKREIVNADGSKDIWYPNGNLKKISPDGMTIRMLYFNRDIKETNINEGTVKYYYAETNTWHTTYVDGLEILEFPNGQTEHRYKNGKVEVHFPNNSIKVTDPSDEHKLEEWRFADGSNLIQMKNGDKILLLSNGQKEIHTSLSKRREYPDGTVKLVYPDGSQETRYSNGRIRLKDKDGKLIMDTQTVC